MLVPREQLTLRYTDAGRSLSPYTTVPFSCRTVKLPSAALPGHDGAAVDDCSYGSLGPLCSGPMEVIYHARVSWMHGFVAVLIPSLSLSRVPLHRIHLGHRILSPLNGWEHTAELSRTPTSGGHPSFVPLSKFMNVSPTAPVPTRAADYPIYPVFSCATRPSILETLAWERLLRISQLSLTRVLPTSGFRPRDVTSSVWPAVSSLEEEGQKW